MSVDVRARVIELAADIFGDDSVTSESTPSDVQTWDSLAQLNLLIALEDEFGVEIAPEDVDGLRDLGELADFVSAKLS
jgi:acyl carrier protein